MWVVLLWQSVEIVIEHDSGIEVVHGCFTEEVNSILYACLGHLFIGVFERNTKLSFKFLTCMSSHIKCYCYILTGCSHELPHTYKEIFHM